MNTQSNLKFDLISESDLGWTRQLHNDPSTLAQLTDVQPVSVHQQREWIESMSKSRTSKRFVVKFAVDTRVGEEQYPVGVFRVDHLDLINRSVMVGLDILGEHRGRGLSYKIYEHFMRYFFNELNMNRMYLKVLETNDKARHIYKKLGFTEEGVDRQAVFRDGAYRDYICMSILKEEYLARTTDRNSDVKELRGIP